MANPWKGKTVIVSGATSGLGLELSKALAAQGAILHLLARDEARLLTTRDALLALGSPSVVIHSIDVSDSHAVEGFKAKLPSHIDLLINAVGKSDRGNLEQLIASDIEELFRINLLSSWNTTKACLDSLRAAHGTIVNIGSLASKLAPAGLGGYALSKFALSALSQQWRLELRKDNVHVLLVCPGPIRRDDAQDRYAELAKDRGLDASKASPGAGAKVKALDPVWLAEKILYAAYLKKLELIVPGKARIPIALSPYFPALADYLLRKSMK